MVLQERPVTAVEQPRATPTDSRICFYDLAIERGLAVAEEVSYQVQIFDARGRLLLSGQNAPGQTRRVFPAGAATKGIEPPVVGTNVQSL